MKTIISWYIPYHVPSWYSLIWRVLYCFARFPLKLLMLCLQIYDTNMGEPMYSVALSSTQCLFSSLSYNLD